MRTAITYSITVDKKGVFFNGEQDLSIPKYENLKEWLTLLYKSLKIDYPKFHKMDNLSKLAFLGVEMLKQKFDLSKYDENEIALIFQNSYSSLDTDKKHQQNIDNQKPSPATFVYTLPNIMIGEIAIRNKWFGENMFVIKESFDKDNWIKSANLLLNMNKANVVLGGWVDVLNEHYEMKLYLLAGRKHNRLNTSTTLSGDSLLEEPS